jgi:hypothetical protein
MGRGKAQAVVDHGEPAGGQREALAIGAGDRLTASSQHVEHPPLGRHPGAGGVELMASQCGKEVALQNDARPLTVGEIFRCEMFGPRR